MSEPPRPVSDYFAAAARWRFVPEGDLDGPADWQMYTGWRGFIVRRVPEKGVARARQLVTRLRRPGAARSVHRLVSPQLHLGCGTRHLAGWANVDLVGTGADIAWDLRRQLPVADGAAAAVFHEHLLEHLPLEAGVGLLAENFRVLRPGGVLRVGLPDFEQALRSYVLADGSIGALRPGRPSRLFALNELVYGYGHQAMWDLDMFIMVMEEIGFIDVQSRPFGVSRLEPAPDWEERRKGTLYVEALKPTSSPLRA